MASVDLADPRLTTHPRLARLAVATIFFANGAMLATWFARIPDIKQRLVLGEGAFGVALLAMAVGALLAQPTAGWAIGRVGSRVVTTAMAVLFCLVAVFPAFAPSLPVLMLVLGVLGACNGGLDVAMNAQAALVEGQYGRSIMNSFHALWSVGGLSGALLGGWAAAQEVPLGTHFLVVAALALGAMLLATRGLVPDRGDAAQHGAAFALPPRALLPLGIVAFCALVCEGAIGDWSAIYLREDLVSPPGVAATGYAVFALVMAGGRFTGDWLTMRLGPALIVRGGGVLVVAGMGLALVSGIPWLAIGGFALVGAGVACIFPLLMSAAARTPGVAPGTGIAAVATAGYTGFLVGPPLIGSVAEVLALRGALGVLVLFGLGIVLFGASVADRKTR